MPETREQKLVRAALFAAGAALVAGNVLTGRCKRLAREAVNLCLSCLGF
jgi:hypothetical protein